VARRAAVLATVAAALALGPAPGLAGPRGALTKQQEAGRVIYETGESPSGGGITAVVGGDPSPLPGSVLTCTSCHGEDGLGRPEGGSEPSIITWSELTRPGGHDHPGRRHRPFDARTIARSITDGVDPDGQRLDGVMPRYSMSREDLDSLLAWLRVLERRLDPGLAPGRIRLGTVLPEAGRSGEVGRAMRATLQAAVKELNRGGGLNGRKVTLEVAGYDPEREAPVAAAKRLVAAGPVFALLSAFAPGGEAELVAWAEAEKLPLVGPFAPFARPGGASHWTFYVQPGPPELARVLVEHARSRPGLADPQVAVLRTDVAGLAEAEAAALRQAELRGWRRTRSMVVGAAGPSREEVARLAADGVEVVVLLGDDRALEGLLGEAESASWAPWILVPGPLRARAAAAAPGAFDGRILLAFPALPSEGDRVRARLSQLEPKVGDRHRAARASAAEAAAVLGEALRRTGRQLSRARLVASLEALYRVETGLGPPVSYGPRRRVGVLGGYVVALDRPRRSFRPVSEWIRLD
jgi:ABC-type branched-subunit amino acid transport system substrate-binding protein